MILTVRGNRFVAGWLVALGLAGCGPSSRVVHAAFDDGAPRSAKTEIQSEDGSWVAQGEFEAWHQDGTQHARGAYVAGAQDGLWQEWYANGQLGSRGEWRAGLQHGEWTYWNEDGALLARGHYAGGAKQGSWTTWHPDGSVKERCSFVDGRLEGVLVHRLPDGSVEGLVSGVYENGAKVADWHLDGERTLLFPDATQRERSEWKNGLRHGESISWHPGGSKDCEGRYENARRTGPWRFWLTSGELDRERTGVYADGRLTGALPGEDGR